MAGFTVEYIAKCACPYCTHEFELTLSYFPETNQCPKCKTWFDWKGVIYAQDPMKLQYG